MKTSHHHIIGTDGQPFFWLADTAWNLWCRGTPDEWDTYLAARKRQGFTAIQFVAGWWRGCSQPIHGKTFDVVDGELIFDEKALRSLDLLMQKIRDAGLVASPVMLWTLMNYDPGQVLSEEQCIEVGRRLLERYDADNVVWLLGGDGNYTAPQVEARWKRIGRAVFADQPDAMATLHPCGVTWVGDAFAAEPWYRLATIQSGHGARENNLRFLVSGDYASAWTRLDMPFINLEPNYENARSYGDRKHLTAYHVRRASYWSLLVAPPAGVTFGINSIWIWARSPNETAERHENAWVGQPWHQELDTPGARSMTVLRAFFESLPWTRLKPAPQRLSHQPGNDDVENWQAVAATPEGDCLVAYAPRGGDIQLDVGGLEPGLGVYAVDPMSGEWTDRGKLAADGGAMTFRLPAGPERAGLLVLMAR
jgi:hypothetical protein